jgi:aspartate kinase
MALIVQKYGGTSVGTVERMKAVAERVIKTVKAGNSVVVVVSAMGKTTDGLVKLAAEISANPSRREMDMLLSTGEQVSIALLSMTLQEMGQPAISLTGAQVGIVTEAEHTRARILNIETDRMERHLKEGKVLVVAGFQGVSNLDDLEITTLGRGGSDTSAVALAAALKADFCEIYTDVPGILTTDPRLVADAQLMSEITADEMLELASLGAKVLHPRSVEIARNYGVRLVVKSSWTDDPGTQVVSYNVKPRSLQGLEISAPVDGIEFATQEAKIALLNVPDRPGIAAQLFGEIASNNLDVDLIIQSIHEGNSNDIAFTLNNQDIEKGEKVASAIAKIFSDDQQQAEVNIDQQTAKVSIAGAGMIGRPGVAAQMFKTLADAGINIEMISTSEVKVSCVINRQDVKGAIAALKASFDVDITEDQSITNNDHVYEKNNLPVRGVALDLKQARLAILQIPDHPGMAAKIFGLLAQKNISVDMIIQSQRSRTIDGNPTRDIACTVARGDAKDAKNILDQARTEIGYGDVLIDEAIAKVSIVGSGMVGHPGVAAKMFSSLAANNINIQMIATSEIKVSCVVAESEGVKALQAVHSAFELGGSDRIQVAA